MKKMPKIRMITRETATETFERFLLTKRTHGIKTCQPVCFLLQLIQVQEYGGFVICSFANGVKIYNNFILR